MAVPFRRKSKTAKRKRRSHYKLQAPALVVCSETGEFTLPHRVTKNSGYYKGRLVLDRKEKSGDRVAEDAKQAKTKKAQPVTKAKKEKKVEAVKQTKRQTKKPSAATKKG